MKVVILAGGMQSTINNENEGIPKPMVDIGGMPLLWHIMKHFSEYGLNEFIICGGYRVDMIKEYFMDYYIYASDITVDLQSNRIEVHKKRTEDWKVTVVNTGLFSSTGQRISLIHKYIEENEFIVTYGDCLSDINIHAMLETYKRNRRIATIALAKPTGRNQLLPIDEEGELRYNKLEKMSNDVAWVNADCFVFHKQVFDYLLGNYDLEKQLFSKLSVQQQLGTYQHKGFWMPIETKRDLSYAVRLWNAGTAPWMKEEK
jgi:Nucleoside-diphosphate-sugar pyrophosphorylase involved in lipopolysaccharide biosynthesis/translation initiation factor 2B, gamma/epsilon subunits (eIF-2Bgamma/eIF-2Bepsilon)